MVIGTTLSRLRQEQSICQENGRKLRKIVIKNMFTKEILKKIYPFATQANLDKFFPYLENIYKTSDINTELRFGAFLAQIGHESGQLRYVKELASGQAYEGSKDLGNTEKGDGVKFKGRGLIQITGRSNYTALGTFLGIDLVQNTELLETPEYAVKSAVWFWQKKKLNVFADIPDFEKITRIINGGLNGYKDRLELYERAKLYL